jgi:hypothetical protein
VPSGWPRSYVNWVTSRNQRDAPPSIKALVRYQAAIGSFGRAIDTSVRGTQGETTGTVPRTTPQSANSADIPHDLLEPFGTIADL